MASWKLCVFLSISLLSDLWPPFWYRSVLVTNATNLGAVGGGDDDGGEDNKEKAEEEERERLEAIREAEERRKEKHRKMEEEREKMRQDIRDKVNKTYFDSVIHFVSRLSISGMIIFVEITSTSEKRTNNNLDCVTLCFSIRLICTKNTRTHFFRHYDEL